MKVSLMNKTLLALGGATACLMAEVVSARAILGVDLGSLYMKVALVQRGAPLEIVTNMHAKRRTEQMVLFDAGTRFYGADANSLYGRKPHLTPIGMSVMLGRTHDHPSVQVITERHYPIRPSYNETRAGVCVEINGESYTPEELVAMVLTHAKEFTSAFGVNEGSIKDCVLTVPSFFTQNERRALLDAALLADLNVLSLIDENTAAGLHFGIDRIDDEIQNVVFYNMGASSLQVSIVQYHSYERKETSYGKGKKVGSFQVLSKAWDATLGGSAFDAVLVEHMANEFNEVWNKKRNTEGKDVRKYPRPMAKLRIQATKVKQVLSANNEIPVYIDSLHDDTNYQSHISRSLFDKLCSGLLDRSSTPISQALKSANLTLDDIHMVELIGGGMRVPLVQEEIKKVLGEKLDLGMHINSDESMALGAAFHGANISTAFRVRHVGMTDVNPWPIAVSLSDLPIVASTGLFGLGKKEILEEEDEEWSKSATVFKSFGKVGVKKTIAFTHDRDVACALDYEENELLPFGTNTALERYNVTGVADFAKEMEEKGLGKPKVSLQFELSSSGITKLVKAEAVVEEIITVEEEVEVEVEEPAEEKKEEETKEEVKTDDAEASEETAEEKSSSDKADTKKKKEVKKETKIVTKEKKKLHKRPLVVFNYHVGSTQPYSTIIMEESRSKLGALALKDKERLMLEEAKNTLESYIYLIKNKLIDDEENIKKVSTEEQRASISKAAEDAEEWMYDDGYDADIETMIAKYEELSGPAKKIFFRVSEMTARPEAISALKDKLSKIIALMTKWESTKPQVTVDERGDVLAKVKDVENWISEKEAEQEATDITEDPAFKSEDVPGQIKSIEKLVSKLNRKPKPVPKKEEKKANETETVETEEKKANQTETEEKTEEPAKSEDEYAPKEESAKSEDESTPKEESAKSDDESTTKEEPASTDDGSAEKQEETEEIKDGEEL